MIGGLQGEFGDLDIKYLKQNISKYPKMSVANIWKLQENTAALCRKISQNVGRSPGERYQRIRICMIGEVETPSSPIRRQNSGCETSRWNVGDSRIPDVNIRVESGGSRV